MLLTAEECAYIMRSIDSTHTSSSHATVWKRRSYAPMCIHSPELSRVKSLIHATYPEYIIAFDVIFDSNGNDVGWHCDYESLGPFDVSNRWSAIKNAHFLSVHFNITPNGGHLVTCNSLLLSYLHYLCISKFGIFSFAHRLAVALSYPLLLLLSCRRDGRQSVGNAFDNTRLHRVAAGAPRTSYVVRLVKQGSVKVSRNSIVTGISRSSACQAFRPLLLIVENEPLDVSEIDWKRAFSGKE